ncbi:MAG: hypothetical protein QOC78_3965 [Solirubrobacteraceae bacterium]|jgi:hypothetical protein|nr:hypothetical protein [Solirubrobacteraceae bacterium]MEA2279005.1 hypothetical protein [Solirubrobacteraceae bacterium]MEA2392150.1 hypothetical protein [Solirubrobacteraceae bacterium]
MPAKTQREREAEQRQAKLERIQEQVDEGSLVIRQMTEEERARFTSGRDLSEESGSQRRSRRRRTRSGARPLPPLPRT